MGTILFNSELGQNPFGVSGLYNVSSFYVIGKELYYKIGIDSEYKKLDSNGRRYSLVLSGERVCADTLITSCKAVMLDGSAERAISSSDIVISGCVREIKAGNLCKVNKRLAKGLVSDFKKSIVYSMYNTVTLEVSGDFDIISLADDVVEYVIMKESSIGNLTSTNDIYVSGDVDSARAGYSLCAGSKV